MKNITSLLITGVLLLSNAYTPLALASKLVAPDLKLENIINTSSTSSSQTNTATRDTNLLASPKINLDDVVVNTTNYQGKCAEANEDLFNQIGGVVAFTDVPTYAWYYNVVQAGVKANMVQGMKDEAGMLLNRFEPERPTLLAEILRMLLGVADDLPQHQPAEPWHEPLMKRGQENGLVELLAVTDNAPIFSKTLTRAEAIPLFLMAACIDNLELDLMQDVFPDVNSNTSYADRIWTAYSLGIVTGYGDGTFRPNEYVSRAEMVALIFRTLSARELLLNR